jgi:hypothetical protein
MVVASRNALFQPIVCDDRLFGNRKSASSRHTAVKRLDYGIDG